MHYHTRAMRLEIRLTHYQVTLDFQKFTVYFELSIIKTSQEDPELNLFFKFQQVSAMYLHTDNLQNLHDKMS